MPAKIEVPDPIHKSITWLDNNMETWVLLVLAFVNFVDWLDPCASCKSRQSWSFFGYGAGFLSPLWAVIRMHTRPRGHSNESKPVGR